MTKVSVILPVYNVDKYLERNINCLLNQTLKDIELIYIDDCSTDNSLSILREYAEKHPNIKVIALEKNSGAPFARNKGLEVATGEYLGFIDTDDDIDLNYYEELYKKAKEDDADIVKCCRKDINLDGSIVYSKVNDEIRKKGKYYFTYEWTTAIYRASMIFENGVKFPEECIKAQDIVFLNRAICVANKLSVIDNTYYNYHRREGSLNSKKLSLDKIKSVITAYGIILDNFNNISLFEDNRDMYMDVYLNRYNCLINILLYQNDTLEAKELCAKALVKMFYNCKDIEGLEKVYMAKNILPYIKSRDVEKLATILFKHRSLKKLEKYKSNFFDKIFSIKDTYDKKKKLLTVCGLSIKFKNRNLDK